MHPMTVHTYPQGLRLPAIVLLGLVYLGVPLCEAGAATQPYVPVNEAVVLETLPRTASADGELVRLRKRLAADPRNRELAVQVAWSLLEQARQTGDPRYQGYAQAALRPWWSTPSATSDVLLLRATIRQNRHDFQGALADLDRLNRMDPHNPRARLTQALVLTVTGQPLRAKESCTRLRGIASSLIETACHAHVSSLTGGAQHAYESLLQALRRAPDDEPARGWVLGLLAEIAVMLGDSGAAQRHFRSALELDPDDRYLRNALADHYLADGQASKAIAALAGDRESDGALLRHALAATALAEPVAAELILRLSRRYAALSRRGDSVHLAEAARFELHLRGDAGRALRLALDNWRSQREPRDALIVLEAALAAQRPAAADGVLAWITRTGIEDVRLRRLLTRLGRLAS